MSPSSWFGADGGNSVEEVLWQDSERIVRRASRTGAGRDRNAVLAVFPVAEHPTPDSLNRLTHEYEVKDDLDDAWAAGASRLTALSVPPWSSDDSYGSQSAYRPRLAGYTNVVLFTRTSSPAMFLSIPRVGRSG